MTSAMHLQAPTTGSHPLHQPGPEQAPPLLGDERLDQSAGFLGMGRSLTFPFPQWRASDPYRTAFFDVGEGPTLVMVHGLGANATHFEHVVRRLVPGHRVVGLDLVGCGWSAKPRIRYTVEILRDHLLSFLDERGIRRATLVAHSMGGAVCLDAALTRPGQFDGLVLLCAAGVGPLPSWMRLTAPLAMRRSVLLPFLGLGHGFILRNVFVTRPETNPYVRWFHESMVRDAPGYPNFLEFVRVCQSLCRDLALRDYSPRFQHVHMPVLALWGDHDRLTTLPSVMKSLDGFNRVRTVVLKDCGHMPMVEYPEETTFHLKRFLQTPP